MEEKVLYNVLKSIGTGNEYKSAPDREYLKSLEVIGIIKMDWDNTITSLGQTILNTLRDKYESW